MGCRSYSAVSDHDIASQSRNVEYLSACKAFPSTSSTLPFLVSPEWHRSDGSGPLVAQQLVKNGHKVPLYARNQQRAKDAGSPCPGAEAILVGDLSDMTQMKQLVSEANKGGSFDCVLHNAGIYQGGFRKTDEGLPGLITVDVIAPYLLTCLMEKPKRLVFLSSYSHYSGDGSVNDLTWQERGEKGRSDTRAYSDSKLYHNMLANAFARRWPDVSSSPFHPGWMVTNMGGRSATGDF